LYSCLFLFSFRNEGPETYLDAPESVYAAIEDEVGVGYGEGRRRGE
jgi:hypothetical protein